MDFIKFIEKQSNNKVKPSNRTMGHGLLTKLYNPISEEGIVHPACSIHPESNGRWKKSEQLRTQPTPDTAQPYRNSYG
jgi:hypothetical protein